MALMWYIFKELGLLNLTIKPLIMISLAPLLLTAVSACRVSDVRPPAREPSPVTLDHEGAIQDLEEGKDKQTVRTAVQTLSDAKTRAFPALLKHLRDKTNAALEYFGAGDTQCAPQAIPCNPYQPTIGDACFVIIQSQIEGNWPKGYRSYYTLTSGNVGEWWESRRNMSLKELQLDAAKSSLARARLNRDVYAIRFLREHLKDVQAGRCCPE